MAVDSLIYNRSQYFPRMIADQFNKSLIPTSGTIKAGATLNPTGGSAVAKQDIDTEITGFIKSGGYIYGQTDTGGGTVDEDCFLVPRNAFGNYASNPTSSCCVPVSSFKNLNWGGKALLSHVYQWFRDAFRMVVIA